MDNYREIISNIKFLEIHIRKELNLKISVLLFFMALLLPFGYMIHYTLNVDKAPLFVFAFIGEVGVTFLILSQAILAIKDKVLLTRYKKQRLKVEIEYDKYTNMTDSW